MAHKVRVVAGNLVTRQAWVGAVVAALFLIFGVMFANVVLNDMNASDGGMRGLIVMFFAIWIVACVAMIVFYARLGLRKQKDSIAELIDDADEPPHYGSNNQS